MVYGPIDAQIKLGLKWLDSETANKLEKKISLEAKPYAYMTGIIFFLNFICYLLLRPMKNPKSVEEMLTTIDNIETVLNAKPYSVRVKDNKILGVPVRYFLVPISNYLDLQIEKLYLKLEEETLEKFSSMLSHIHNFSRIHCISRRVFDQYNLANKFIFNKKSEITVDIYKYEKEIIDITKIFFPKAVNTLKDYKIHKCDELQLLSLISEFEEKFNIVSIENKIDFFIETCEKELTGIRYDDGKDNESDYDIFVEKFSLDRWLSSEKDPIILLKTNGKPPKGTFILSYFKI